MGTWVDFLRFYRTLTKYHYSDNAEYHEVTLDCQSLNVVLRKYQQDAVKWMVFRERTTSVSSHSQNVTADGIPVLYSKGGILADEMGLGKTIEILALILNNPSTFIRTLPASSSPPHIPVSSFMGESSLSSSESTIVTQTVFDSKDLDLASKVTEENNDNRRPQRKAIRRKFVVEDDSSDEGSAAPAVKKSRRTLHSSDEDYEPPSASSSRQKQSPKQKENSDSEEFIPHRRIMKKKISRKNSYVLDTNQKEKFKLGSGELQKVLKEWYDMQLKRWSGGCMDSDSDAEDFFVRCHCNNNHLSSVLVQCENCRYLQHKKCVGLDLYNPHYYYCPECWSKKPKISTGATLIVSPDAIVQQWQDEIKKHVNKTDLKVLYYYGAKSGQYFQPEYLADQDIVITTYQSLSNELVYTNIEEARSLRHRKRYHSLKSPLVTLNWYRIVLDEAQMAESVKSKISEMIQKFSSTMKWAVTGTPIQKSFSDLYGLMVFLGVTPLNDVSEWNRLMSDRKTNMHLLWPIMWRSNKDDVLSQLNVPDRKIVNHLLKFSPTENYFYQRTFKECHSLFSTRTVAIMDWTRELRHLDRKMVNKILQPLLQVRQACTHPQVVGGKFKNLKKTMTMEELLTAMVKRVQGDVDVAVRAWVAALNGQAGLHILLGAIPSAVRLYKSVLAIPNDFQEGTIKIDILQKIHTLHNLSYLEPFTDDTIRSSTPFEEYAAEAASLEREYLKKYQSLLQREQENLDKLGSIVSNLSEGKGLNYSDWWSRVVSSELTNPTELIEKIKCHVFETHLSKFQIKKSYALRVRNVQSLCSVMQDWLEKTDAKRYEIYKNLDLVQRAKSESFTRSVYDCHLNPNKSKKDKSKCKLCNIKTMLEEYEINIFEVPKHQEDRKKNSKCVQDAECIDDDPHDNRAISELHDVQLFRTKKEGNWKPGQMERTLSVILSYAKNANIDEELVNAGTKHLQVVEAARKEFKSLRALWSLLNDQVAANDELTMAKLRYEYAYEEKPSKNNTKSSESNVIPRSSALPKLEELKEEAERGQTDASRSVGIMQYLLNLQADPNSERDPCPVCREVLSDKWSVLQCGHCYCFDCIPTLLNFSISSSIECAVCRKKTSKVDIAFVDCTQRERTEGDLVVKGSYSTKVEAVVLETLRIKSQAPEDKILIFSTWDRMLDLIGESFTQNDIIYKRLKGSKNKSQRHLDDFKHIPDVTALLLPLQKGSKGLNLTEAKHVFFVEPILDPADETQAIGRVHRIGQTKETFVHRFIVSNTIEERMMSALDAHEGGEVTIVHLHQLFSNPGAES